jgi:uncharacterized protein (TIGR02996 family)
MTERDAFMQAILANPDDDAPRLIFADWLEEHGDPFRAEFIRVQCRLAQMDEFDPEREALEERETALEEAFGGIWQLEIPATVRYDRVFFRRGFVGLVMLEVADWLAEPGRWETLTPIEGYAFRDSSQDAKESLPALAASSALARLRWLSLLVPEDEGARTLTASPHLGRLEALELADSGMGDDGARFLARANWPRLRTLDLTNNQIGGRGWTVLLEPAVLPSLRRLELSYNQPSTDSVEALARHPGTSRLQSLGLQGLEMGPAGAAILAASPHTNGLRSLELACNNLGDTGVLAIAESRELAGLIKLDLYRNGVGAAGAAALAQSQGLHQLRDLRLARNSSLGVRGIRNLLHSDRALRRLDLTDCRLGDEGVKVLARSAALANLSHLDLASNQITDEGAKFLARSKHLRHLRLLNLSGNRIGDAGVAALARSAMVQSITCLTLDGNRIGLKGVRALARSPNLARLRRLDLWNNPIEDRSALALARSKALPESPLFVLDIRGQHSFGSRAEQALKDRFGTGVR